jgi:hypothetical protein
MPRGWMYVNLALNNGSEAYRKAKLLNHYTTTRASDGYYQHGYFKDDVCQLDFVNNVELYFHYLGGEEARGETTTVSPHRDRILNQSSAYANIAV